MKEMFGIIIQNGEIVTDTTTLVKYNDSWWYVKDGRIDFGANTLVKYNGKWFYVRGDYHVTYEMNEAVYTKTHVF